jgi:hypothetical protein
MKTKFTNAIIDILLGTKANQTIFHMWGGLSPVPMGDGVKFRVMKSPVVDYVYIRYLNGYENFEIEFGGLVGGVEYDIIDRVQPVPREKLVSTISKRLFAINVVEPGSNPVDGDASAAAGA